MKFFNKQLLKQARKAIDRMIDESPENIIIYRKAMTDDGFRGMVIDPQGIETAHEMKVRLSHENKFPGNYDTAPGGLSTNLARYILTDYKTLIYDGDSFESSFGKQYKIGSVDPLKKFDSTKIIGYQAPLTEAVKMVGT